MQTLSALEEQLGFVSTTKSVGMSVSTWFNESILKNGDKCLEGLKKTKTKLDSFREAKNAIMNDLAEMKA